MRALRIPVPQKIPPSVPAWIIDGDHRDRGERREAPRLEVPRVDDIPGESERHTPSAEPVPGALPAPGSTVIVIPL
jgi:hypothetical protein